MTREHTQTMPELASKGLAALTRVFSIAARDLQRCAPLDSDPALNTALARIGATMGADRAYIFEVVDTVFVRNTHEWCAEGITTVKDDLQHVPYTSGAYFWERFRDFGSIQIPDVSALLSMLDLRQILEEQNITALIAAPFWRNGEIAGFVGLDYTHGPRGFLAEEDNLLRGFAAQVGMLRALTTAERAAVRLDNDLARTRGQLDASVAALPELLVETDPQGVIIGFQQSTPLTFAVTPQEVIGQTPECVLPSHLAAICRKAMREVDLFGWSQSHDYKVDTTRGQKWYTLYATSRSLSVLDKTHGYLFVVRDVTHAQLQSQQVRQLVRVAEQSNNIILLTDGARRIRWMNPAAVTRTGYAPKDAEGLRPSEILHLAKASPEIVSELCRSLDEGHFVHREVRAQTRDGVIYWLELDVQPLFESSGEIEGYMVIGTDVTSNKQTEMRLQKMQRRAMRVSHDGIAIICPTGSVAYANPAFREILGIAEDDSLQESNWSDITPADLTERIPDILPVLMSNGVWHGDVSWAGPNGMMQHFALTLSVQDDRSILVAAADITSRKQAEQEQANLREQLQRAQSRQLGAQLAAGMAHDFSNVLAAISSSVDALQNQTGPHATATMARIRAATEEARTLARSLTRLETARPEAIMLELAPVLQQAADFLRSGLEAPMQMTLDLPAETMTVFGDRMELMQVVLNLLLNARDACRDSLARDPSGPATLQLGARDCPAAALPVTPDIGAILPDTEYVVIEVADCGDGIDPDLRESIFNPYLSSKGDAGAGLGLAVVADIVRARGAALHISDNTPKGTRVLVFWPCAAPARLDMAQTATPLADTSILLVDNDDTVLQELSDILSRAGAEVASCVDPADALDAVTQSPQEWHLVLTDYNMGPTNGLELAQKMHQQREDLPIVLMSGNSELHFAKESVQTVFAATLRKPVCPNVLISVLLAAKLRSQRHI
ncbi:MAG: PAS domain S-box protein [Alphaproteobacteria bacterium]|jgi:PAS domain S-box-containing protein|nr:PAS domain S-box protein [Alphaproteobacteria bacterium]